MNNLTIDILKLIFGYCNRSCLYPLLLTSKRIGSIAGDIILPPKVLVVFKYRDSIDQFYNYDKINGELANIDIEVSAREYRFISWKQYSKFKRLNLRCKIAEFTNGGSTIFTDVNMKRIRDKEFIKFISRFGVKKFSSTYIDNIHGKYKDDGKYVKDDDEPTIFNLEYLDKNIYYNLNYKNVPDNILEYIDHDCKAVYYLVSSKFKFSKKAVKVAIKNDCVNNIKVYYEVDKNKLIEYLKELEEIKVKTFIEKHGTHEYNREDEFYKNLKVIRKIDKKLNFNQIVS